MAYTFTMQSVTFALVFFGYVARGWEAVWERLLSVFVGVFTSILCNMFFSATDGGIGEVTAIVAIIEKSEQIFNRSIVALDFAFMRNTILAAESDEDVMKVGTMEYEVEVLSWFRFITDDEGKLQAEEPATAEELRELARSTTFHDLPMDVTVSVLQAECRQCWSDMRFIRAIFPHNFCGRRIFQTPLPSFCSLPERAHPVFLQASALAHSGAIERELWNKEGKELEQVRVAIQGLQPHFAKLFRYKLMSQKQKRGPSEEDRKEVLDALDELVNGLDRAQSGLNGICTQPGTSRSSSSRLLGLFSVRGSQWAGLTAGDAEDHMAKKERLAWERFHGFCQGLSLIIMDFSLFVLCCIKLMAIDSDTDDSRIMNIEQKLASIGCMDLSVLEEQMEAPLDIGNSDIVKNFRKRAKKAARAALQPLGLQDLVPKHKHRRGGSGQTSKAMTGGTHSAATHQSQSLQGSPSHSLGLDQQRSRSQSSSSSSAPPMYET